ncbi:MAG TPA: hypothetical protein VGA08_01390 [Candidatus Saccharimonadales bacterium]
MKDQYRQALEKFKQKDTKARLIMNRLHRSLKSDHKPYLLSAADIRTVNEAREAWFEFLRFGRK